MYGTHVVARMDRFGTTFYLRLKGPFEYATWSTETREATMMVASKAFAWAEAYGGRAVNTVPPTPPKPPARPPEPPPVEKAPDTLREIPLFTGVLNGVDFPW